MNEIVRCIFAQSLCFGASWVLTYLGGYRIRWGHWAFSLLFLGTLNLAAYRVVHIQDFGPLPIGGWLPVGGIVLATVALTKHWNVFGQACFSSTLLLSTYFLFYVIAVTAQAHLGPVSLLFSLLLLALQAFALLLLCTGSYEVLDVMCRIRWRRVREPDPENQWLPHVSIHVPAYNEPPDMVIETLDTLAQLDYPSYEVIVVDDNTSDPALWRPIEAHCQKLGFKFFHLENWPGFKSGALNYALQETDPAVEIIGVVDSDYIVQPNYLRECVGHFRDSKVAFVQSPQDYREGNLPPFFGQNIA